MNRPEQDTKAETIPVKPVRMAALYTAYYLHDQST
jgi:hypothetical protein